MKAVPRTPPSHKLHLQPLANRQGPAQAHRSTLRGGQSATDKGGWSL